jgi:hypothetical protein
MTSETERRAADLLARLDKLEVCAVAVAVRLAALEGSRAGATGEQPATWAVGGPGGIVGGVLCQNRPGGGKVGNA